MAQRFICVGKKQSKKFDFLCSFSAKIVDALHNCRIVADARNFQGLFWRYKDSGAIGNAAVDVFERIVVPDVARFECLINCFVAAEKGFCECDAIPWEFAVSLWTSGNYYILRKT